MPRPCSKRPTLRPCCHGPSRCGGGLDRPAENISLRFSFTARIRNDFRGRRFFARAVGSNSSPERDMASAHPIPISSARRSPAGELDLLCKTPFFRRAVDHNLIEPRTSSDLKAPSIPRPSGLSPSSPPSSPSRSTLGPRASKLRGSDTQRGGPTGAPPSGLSRRQRIGSQTAVPNLKSARNLEGKGVHKGRFNGTAKRRPRKCRSPISFVSSAAASRPPRSKAAQKGAAQM